jgi:hypothetical protein
MKTCECGEPTDSYKCSLCQADESVGLAPKAEQDEPVAWNEDQAYAWGRGCYETAQTPTTKSWKLFGQLTPREQAYWVAKAAFKQSIPQPRKWVGLTEEDMETAEEFGVKEYRQWKSKIRGQQITPQDNPQWHIYKAIEAKLKEKNNG